MWFCGDSSSLECVRGWSTIAPAVLVLLIGLAAIPISISGRPLALLKTCTAPFTTYLTLQEAEALDADATPGDTVAGDEDTPISKAEASKVPLWRAVLFVSLGLVEALSWLSVGSYHLITESSGLWEGAQPFLLAFVWIYTTIRPIVRRSATPPYDLFSIYLLELVHGIFELGGVIYDHGVNGAPLPPASIMFALSANLAAILTLLGVVLAMPLAVPSDRVSKDDIGHSVTPEDYTTLFGWITFSWVYPLVQRGRNTTLNEKDVWALSPSIQSRPIFIKFSSIITSSLLRRLWIANSLDLILDFVLTFISVCFNYCSPFFLNRILAAIEKKDATPADRSRAYVYAFLMFLCALGKSEADVQHLWLGRRAATRIRSELMASIYDKALKRKDYSGIIDKGKQKEAEDKKAASAASPPNASDKPAKKTKEEKAKEAKADDPKAGADVGKIVNLMAGDANRISGMISGAYFIYGAPLEVIIGSVFLYQLLGWSAFVGFIVLVAGWPLNSYLSKRSIRINKGTLTARDKRMGVLNELIGAVKFIKFFAWEEQWIGRASEARAGELSWMTKSRINSVLFYLLWITAPILISVISFFAYVMQGNTLSISVAFTAIALFSMIRQPLNVIPTWIIQILQTGVALKRIAVYLDEDEVTDQVSSLKKERNSPHLPGTEPDEGLGLEHATLKWNEVEEAKDTDKGKTPEAAQSSSPTSSEDENTTAVDSDAATIGESTDHKFELRDITVKFPERELTVITGPTASGKTALLMALLGEMTLLEGRIIMSKDISKVDEYGLMHAISYAAQSPWLRHQSIKDNVLFGYPYDEERYNQVIECCALRPDLEVLEDGDATEIGARGVSLSGGQKARVALARAVYAQTKYVLLDDPLSAVDSHTSRLLFDKLLRGPLLANRTVILVTHHVELVLPGAHYLVRMLDGRVDTHGTIKDLRAQGVLEEIAHDASVDAHKEDLAAAEEAAIDPETAGDEVKKPEDDKKARKLVKDEHRETGGVKWRIYKGYLKASSYWIWAFLVTLVLLSQIMTVVEKLWIKIWGDAYDEDLNASHSYFFKTFATPEHDMVMDGYSFQTHAGNSYHIFTRPGFLGINWPSAVEHPLYYVGVYAAIGGISALISVASTMAQYTGALRASRILFKQLLVSVVRATFRFHDTTPQGRMLNRFGKDIETIDTSLAGSLQAVNSSMASFFASILTVTAVFPLFLLPATLLGFLYRELAIGYLNTGRDLRRMESNTRSPIFSDFGELLEGIVTVRAFSAEKRFLDNLHKKIDTTTQMWYGFWMTNRWLLLNFDFLGAAAVLVTTLFSIYGLRDNAGLAGLCITSALSFTMSVYWACRFWTALELDLNSVERIVEYLDLPQEPPAVIEDHRPPAYWPSSTSNNPLISVENLVIKYAPELPAVLHDVSFDLKAGERIGLLGRTGSGKSTLAMSILRFTDPTSGRILIDGIDISTIGIHDLRARLTFIPQDATLFSGSLRDNLDPFNEHEDSECMEALYRVHMISRSQGVSQRTSREHSVISSPATSRPPSIHGAATDTTDTVSVSTTTTDVDVKTTVSLETQVSAGGTNFSQGQRQLIAMARALLRKSSIIVLDEATSSIDFATDAKIQTAIREEFNDSLLLTVAHRLRTVIDYDRLVVLDKGKLAEFDTPLNLINKEDGIFRNMCLKSGSFGELEAAAKAKAERDRASSGSR